MRTRFRLGKRSLYPWIFLAIVVAVNAGIYLLVPQAKSPELYLAVTVAVAGFVHFLYSQHHQDTRLFVELFKEFNVRYDSLNGKLNAIVARESIELSAEDKAVLFDYFNLCAEEFLFYQSGYIDQDVWRSWLAGMKYFARHAAVRSLWEADLKSNSYYGFSVTLFDAVP